VRCQCGCVHSVSDRRVGSRARRDVDHRMARWTRACRVGAGLYSSSLRWYRGRPVIRPYRPTTIRPDDDDDGVAFCFSHERSIFLYCVRPTLKTYLPNTLVQRHLGHHLPVVFGATTKWVDLARAQPGLGGALCRPLTQLPWHRVEASPFISTATWLDSALGLP